MTFKTAVLLILGGLLANNYMFEKLLGSATLLGFSKKENKLMAAGLGVLAVVVLSAPLTWAVYTFILEPAHLGFLQLLVFMALILCMAYLVAWLAGNLFKKDLGAFFPVLAVNGAVLGLALTMIADGLSFVPAMLTAVGVGLGFFCALFIFAALREKIDELFVPKSFRGLPIELLAAGIISMALLAFK